MVFPPQVTSLTAVVGARDFVGLEILVRKKFITFLVTYQWKNTAQYVVRTLSHLQCWCPLNMAGLYLSGLSVMHSAYFCKLRTEYHRPIADVNMLQLRGGGEDSIAQNPQWDFALRTPQNSVPRLPNVDPHLKLSTSSNGAPAIFFFLNYTYSQICLVS